MKFIPVMWYDSCYMVYIELSSSSRNEYFTRHPSEILSESPSSDHTAFWHDVGMTEFGKLKNGIQVRSLFSIQTRTVFYISLFGIHKNSSISRLIAFVRASRLKSSYLYHLQALPSHWLFSNSVHNKLKSCSICNKWSCCLTLFCIIVKIFRRSFSFLWLNKSTVVIA